MVKVTTTNALGDLLKKEKYKKKEQKEQKFCVFAVIGKNALERDRAVEMITSKEPEESCEMTFDGEKVAIEAVLQELNTFSLFSEKKVIVLRRLDKLHKDAAEKLVKYLENPAPFVCFVVSAEVLAANTRLYRALGKAGVVLQFAEGKDWEVEKMLPSWLAEEACRYGKQLEYQAARLLVERVSREKELLNSEIEKLVCFVGERQKIRLEDVRALCLRGNLDSIWELGRAVLTGNGGRALEVAHVALDGGMTENGVFGQLRRQFQTSAQVCSILAAGGAAHEVQKQFPYMQGGVLDQNIQQARGYGLARLREGLLLIDEMDLFSKNNYLTPEVLVDALIGKLL